MYCHLWQWATNLIQLFLKMQIPQLRYFQNLHYATMEYRHILITSVSHNQEQLSLFRKELRESREPDRYEKKNIYNKIYMVRIRKGRLRQKGNQLIPMHPGVKMVIPIRKRRKLFKVRSCSSINIWIMAYKLASEYRLEIRKCL